MWLCSQRHISNPLRGSLLKIITFIGLSTSWEEKAFPITMYTYAICAMHTLDTAKPIHKRQTHPLITEDVT
jgi:hypothetical protein